MSGSDSNISVLFLTALIVAFGVTALNLGGGSSATQEAGLERVLNNRGHYALDPRTFLIVSALGHGVPRP